MSTKRRLSKAEAAILSIPVRRNDLPARSDEEIDILILAHQAALLRLQAGMKPRTSDEAAIMGALETDGEMVTALKAIATCCTYTTRRALAQADMPEALADCDRDLAYRDGYIGAVGDRRCDVGLGLVGPELARYEAWYTEAQSKAAQGLYYNGLAQAWQAMPA